MSRLLACGQTFLPELIPVLQFGSVSAPLCSILDLDPGDFHDSDGVAGVVRLTCGVRSSALLFVFLLSFTDFFPLHPCLRQPAFLSSVLAVKGRDELARLALDLLRAAANASRRHGFR